MDWGRAKTILIWLFIILNLFLGLQLYLREQQIVVLSSEQIDDVKALLERGNLFVEVEIPRSVKAEPSLAIELESPDIPKVIQSLQQKGYEKTKKNMYRNQQERVRLKNSVELLYTSPGALFQPSKFTAEEAQKSADNMLNFMGVSTRQYRLVGDLGKVLLDSGEYQFLYHRVFKGKTIYNNEIQVRVSPKGVTYVRIATMNPHLYEERIGIRPATEALIQVFRSIQRGDVKKSIPGFSEDQPHYITALSFGYFVDQKNGQWVEGATGTALKVWRIVIDEKYVVYVNAVDMGVYIEV